MVHTLGARGFLREEPRRSRQDWEKRREEKRREEGEEMRKPLLARGCWTVDSLNVVTNCWNLCNLLQQDRQILVDKPSFSSSFTPVNFCSSCTRFSLAALSPYKSTGWFLATKLLLQHCKLDFSSRPYAAKVRPSLSVLFTSGWCALYSR